jgi:hypothetical protein
MLFMYLLYVIHHKTERLRLSVRVMNSFKHVWSSPLYNTEKKYCIEFVTSLSVLLRIIERDVE